MGALAAQDGSVWENDCAANKPVQRKAQVRFEIFMMISLEANRNRNRNPRGKQDSRKQEARRGEKT